MNKEQKNQVIDDLAATLNATEVFYVTDTSTLNAEKTAELRRECFKRQVQLHVVKNTLLRKALERMEGKDFSELYPVLGGPTALMISSEANTPARLIRDFRKKNDRPLLKGAYLQETIFVGDDQLPTLVDIKSKEELIGDLIALLQSPAKNVISALQSGGQTIAGLVKTLSERPE